MKIAQSFRVADQLIFQHGARADEIAENQFLEASDSPDAEKKLEVVVAVKVRQQLLRTNIRTRQ